MIWFYERHGVFLRCETRDVPAGNDAFFDLVIIEPNGDERVERFKDSAALMHRQKELETTLVHDGWSGPFGRTI
jgi:hypothetical protein